MINSKTINFFREISNISRESGNEKNIAKFLCSFAEKRNFKYTIDRYNNVIIYKKTADKPAILLQAHQDMVCVKKEDSSFNFETDAINIIEDGEYLRANGTTLGADNGIGIAQILNILDSNILCNIEAVFTTEEETTMNGSINIDLSEITAQNMISLDSFEENTITIESAAFTDIRITKDLKYIKSNNDNIYQITVKGLLGGHSGFDIDKNRGNAVIILANIIKNINEYEIVDYVGGTRNNVIPSSSKCILYTNKTKEDIDNIVKENINKIVDLYPNIEIVVESLDINEEVLLNSNEIIDMLINFPCGVFMYNEDNKPVISANLGVINLRKGYIEIGMRCSRKNEYEKYLNNVKNYVEKYNFEIIIDGNQPGFESNKNSLLVKTLINTYPKNINSKGPILKSEHITVEAGFFKEKLPNIDIVIISPKILNAHSIEEKVDINSIYECDKWLENFIKSF